MDGTHDVPIADPPATQEAGPTLPDPAAEDPLCRMLDKLEISVQQPAPIWTKYADPLCRALDEVEAFMERQDCFIKPPEWPPRVTFSYPKNEIRQHTQVTAEPVQISPTEADRFKQSDSPIALSKVSLPVNEPLQKVEGIYRIPSSKQYPEPSRRMTGHNTGIRNTGHEIAWYCNVHREWVTSDECDSCDDFEETDFTDDEGNVRCQHSFLSDSEEQDKNENSDTEESTDE
jgi:hypothetical protein